MGIERGTAGWLGRWLKKRLAALYLLGMLHPPAFPVLVGYCQYEPHVLKLTPPLSITPEETRQVCATVASVLRRPLYRLLGSALVSLVKSLVRARRQRPGGPR